MRVPDNLSAAAGTGSRVTVLTALRDRLAADLDVCESARDVAALAARLMDVLDRIAAAEKDRPNTTGTALDELTKRRKAAGRPDPPGAPRARGAAR